jgi:undecaprenyl-diphosphatase
MMDKPIFYFINKGCNNGFFDAVMPWVSHLGSQEFLLVAGLIMLFSRNSRIRIFGLALIAGLLLSYHAVHYLKVWIARPRPCVALPDVHALIKETSFSFPSLHSTNIFMAVALFSSYAKRYRYLYILAGVVAISRIYVGVHYPSDVMAGALLGIIIGCLLGRLVQKGGHDEKTA